MVKIKETVFFFAVLMFFGWQLNAQKTLVYSNEDADYSRALELFGQGKYSAAQRKFKKVYKREINEHSEVKMNSEYYIAMCALELFNKDAEILFNKFIDHHPQSPKVRMARFQLGKYNYRGRRWSKVVHWLEQVDVNDLEPEQIPEYHFKYGYALFKRKKYQEAKEQFHQSKDMVSDYQVASQFYYGHLAYQDKNYDTALKIFKPLEVDSGFGPIVPYYISQIYYLKKDYDKLVAYAPALYERSTTKRAPEIARVLSEAYFQKEEYKKAATYLEAFFEKSANIDSLANYQLGFCYYKLARYEEAIPYFQKAVNRKNKIGQLSLYYLGDCYLKMDQKKAARSAFRFASKEDFDIDVKENALFNYAKLSFELDIDPYHEAIIALENYIDKYPGSPNVAKARKYLLNVYLNTKNYQRAIVALDKIKDKNMDLKFAYQKIAYYRGIQLFNQEVVGNKKDKSNYLRSIYYLQKSLQYPEDKQIVALAYYWQGEGYYRVGGETAKERKKNYNKSLEKFDKFKSTSASILLPEYKEVDYNKGYVYLGLKDYGKAIRSFRTYENIHSGEKNNKLNDALLRTGDAYLIMSNASKTVRKKDDLIHATRFYKKAIKQGIREMDYAYFQLAQAQHLLNNYALQAEALEHLIFTYPKSEYTDDAKFIVGKTYHDFLGKYDLAIKYYTDVVTNHTNNVPLVQHAYNRMGNIYREKKMVQLAEESFDKGVKLNPRSKYGLECLEGYRLVCTKDLGDFSKYEKYRSNLGMPALADSARDRGAFEAARKFYAEKQYEKATEMMTTYLNDFPNGINILDAHYMQAEAYYNLGKKTESLKGFEAVVNMPYNKFSEDALYKSATIYLEQKNYQKVISHCLALESKSQYDIYILDARVGLMRSYKALEDNNNLAKYAELVQNDQKVKNQVKYEASLNLGRANLALFKFDEALKAFQATVGYTQGIMGAEAKYNIAYIYYLKENYKKSTEEIYDLTKTFSGYKYWITKSFLLLSDNFVKQGDFFQAKYVLNTILENSTDQDLKAQATKKKADIEELERAKIQVKEEENIEIEIGNASEEDKKLFEFEEEEEELEEIEVNDSIVAPVVAPNDTIKK